MTREEEKELKKFDDYDTKAGREMIREQVVPHYRYFLPENQKKIRNTLTCYLSANSEKPEWVFASHQIPLDSEYGKLFYSLVWKERYGNEGPDPIHPDDCEEDSEPNFVNSLWYSEELEKKYNPSGEKPSIVNVIARLKHPP